MKRMILALMMMGCGSSEEDVTIFVASPEIMQAATQAAQEWNACGKRQIILSETKNEKSLTLSVTTDTIYADNGSVVQGFTRFQDDEPTGIVIHNIEPYTRLIIAHEFGHVLIGDTHLSSGLMKAKHDPPDPFLTVSKEDCKHIKD